MMRTCKVLTSSGQDKFLICWWEVDPNLFQLPPLLQGQGFPIGIRQIEHILEFIKLHIFFNVFWIVFVQYVPLSFLWGASPYSLTPESFRAASVALIYHCNINLLVSSVRSSYSHPNLLLITTTPLFQITQVLNTGLSLSEPLQLYKGYNAI